MKWFQWDVGTPDDPRIQALMEWGAAKGLIGERAALGTYSLVVCHVARMGLATAPGLGVYDDGYPLGLDHMTHDCRFASVEDLLVFLEVLADNQLIDPTWWHERAIVYIPDLQHRLDDYTRRRVMKKGKGKVAAVVRKVWEDSARMARPRPITVPLSTAVHTGAPTEAPPTGPAADVLSPEFDAPPTTEPGAGSQEPGAEDEQ